MATKRIPVKSSVIRSIAFDSPSRVMEIEFESGDIYCYNGVAPRVVAELRGAPSVGRHFAKEVKPNFAGIMVKRGKVLADVIDREPAPGRAAESVCVRCESVIVRGSLATAEDVKTHQRACVAARPIAAPAV